VTDRPRVGPLTSFTVAGIEIWGGAAGLYSVLHVLNQSPRGLILIVVTCVAGLFYLTSLLAGVTLLQRKDIGRRLSILVQALQLVTFKVGGLSYLLYAGAAFFVGFAGFEITLNFQLASEFRVTAGSTDDLSMALNLVSIAALALLLHRGVVAQPGNR
jgi:hypothetical protein